MNLTNNLSFSIFSPLDQFNIVDLIYIGLPILGNINISLTNIGLYIILSFIIIFLLHILSMNKKIIPNR